MSNLSVRIQQYQTAGGVIIHQQQMLLLHRPSRQEVRLPKGHIDSGETATDDALRETTEESGYCDLTIMADLGSQVVEFTYQGQHYVRTEHYFLMTLTSEQQRERPPEDQAQFQVMWLPMTEAVAALTFEAEKQVARSALAAYGAVISGGIPRLV